MLLKVKFFTLSICVDSVHVEELPHMPKVKSFILKTTRALPKLKVNVHQLEFSMYLFTITFEVILEGTVGFFDMIEESITSVILFLLALQFCCSNVQKFWVLKGGC